MYIQAYRRPMNISLTFLGMIMFIGAILYFLGFNIPVSEPPYLPLVLGSFLFLGYPVLIYFNVKKDFFSNRSLQEEIGYEFGEEGFRQTGETFNAEVSWDSVFKIVELKDWVLIYQSKMLMCPVQKRSFSTGQLKEFKALIAKKNINRNKFLFNSKRPKRNASSTDAI